MQWHDNLMNGVKQVRLFLIHHISKKHEQKWSDKVLVTYNLTNEKCKMALVLVVMSKILSYSRLYFL